MNPLPVRKSKFGLSEMKDEEALLFVDTCLENGSDVKEAIADMKMIDNLLYMKKLHLVVHGQIKRTQAGNFRKGSDLHNSLMSIVNGRAENLIT